jgi:hypothetical protein
VRGMNVMRRKAKHSYSIRFLRAEGNRRFYNVKITGDEELDFIGWITTTKGSRMSVRAAIRKWSERNFERLRIGDTIAIDLEEVQKH